MHRDDEYSLSVFGLDKLVSHDYHLQVSAFIFMPKTDFGIGSALD
jgi:hypothetical protein